MAWHGLPWFNTLRLTSFKMGAEHEHVTACSQLRRPQCQQWARLRTGYTRVMDRWCQCSVWQCCCRISNWDSVTQLTCPVLWRMCRMKVIWLSERRPFASRTIFFASFHLTTLFVLLFVNWAIRSDAAWTTRGYCRKHMQEEINILHGIVAHRQTRKKKINHLCELS